MGQLQCRFQKNPDLSRPPISHRKPLIIVPKGRVAAADFEKFYLDAQQKGNVQFPPAESSLLQFGSVAGKAFRSNTIVDITGKDERGNEKQIELPLGQAIINRIWVGHMAAVGAVGDQLSTLSSYIARGGNVAVKGIIEEGCTLNFLPSPVFAEQLRTEYRRFLDEIPSRESFGYDKVFHEFKNFDFDPAANIIKNYLWMLKCTASFRYQSHAAGLPEKAFRFVGSTTLKNNVEQAKLDVVIHRIFFWEPDMVEKIKQLDAWGFPIAKPVAVITNNGSEFLVTKNEGRDIIPYIEENRASIRIPQLLQLYGTLLRNMHHAGIGHDDPTKIVVKLMEQGYPQLTIVGYEDMWIKPERTAINYEDRKPGMKRLMDALSQLQKADELILHFAAGYGKDDLEKSL